MSELSLTLLGTSCAGGLPVYGCQCKACTRARSDSRFQRKQCSAVVETGEFRLLIDAGLHDLPERFPPGSLSAILLTHYHVDHVQGLFHWRWGQSDHLSVLGPDDKEGCADLLKHPGFLNFSHSLTAFEPIAFGTSGELLVTPLPLNHSRPVFGYFFETDKGSIAYLTDTVGLPESTRSFLLGRSVNYLVIDCTHSPDIRSPRNHNNLDMVLEIHDDIQPKTTVLTHISHELDCWLMDHETHLPEGIIAGLDAQQFTVRTSA